MSEAALKKPEPIAKGPRKLLANALVRSEVARPDYRVIVKDLNTTFDDVLRPEYWANVAGLFNKDRWPYAKIELIWLDGSKYLELLVVDCGPVHAKVRVLSAHDWSKLTQEDEPESNSEKPQADYILKHKGMVKKWCIIRTSDNEIISDGHADKADAQKYLDDYRKALSK